MTTCNPDLKQIFSDPPMISYRLAPNIRDKVVQANHSGHMSYQSILSPEHMSYQSILSPEHMSDQSILPPEVLPSVTERVIQEVMPIPLEQFTLFYLHKKLRQRCK